MKKILSILGIWMVVGITIGLMSINVYAQDELPTEASAWLTQVEETDSVKSIDVEDVLDEASAERFVNIILRMGLEQEDPELGTPLSPDAVLEIMDNEMPILFDVIEDTVYGVGTVSPGARVWKGDYEGRWCAGPHTFNIQVWAVVNKWIAAAMNKTKIVWKIFKPNYAGYSTDCMYLNVHSNGSVTVSLKNNGPLKGPLPGMTSNIPTGYRFTQYISTPNDLVLKGQTSQGTSVSPWILDGASWTGNFPNHFMFKLWNWVQIPWNTSPGRYATSGPSAVITVSNPI